MSYQDLLNKLQFLTQKYQINERDKEELEQNYISIQYFQINYYSYKYFNSI